MVSKAQILKFATIDYTCGCGLYVHPDNPLTSCKAIHIDDCEFKMNIDRIIGRYNFHRGALNIRNSVKETAKEFNLSSRIVCEALGFTEEFIKDFGDDLPARRAPMNSTLQMSYTQQLAAKKFDPSLVNSGCVSRKLVNSSKMKGAYHVKDLLDM